MKIHIKQFKPSAVVETIAASLQTTTINQGAETDLNFPDNIATGFIKGIEFYDGIGLLIFNATLQEDLEFVFEMVHQPIRSIFLMKGKLTHIIEADHFRYHLEPFKGSISASTDSNAQSIVLAAQTKVTFVSLEVNRKKFFPRIAEELKSLPENFSMIFQDTKLEEHFLYQSDYSLVIAEILNDITTTDYKGFVRKIYLESKALEMLSMHIKQYQDDQLAPRQQQILRKEDIQMIIDARKVLEKEYQNPPTIKALAKMMGTNENKLMKGFRKIFNKTVSETITDIRFNQAKILLAEGELSMKAIAYAIGYKNPSNFSRRFKQRYGFLPKYFARKYLVESHEDD